MYRSRRVRRVICRSSVALAALILGERVAGAQTTVYWSGATSPHWFDSVVGAGSTLQNSNWTLTPGANPAVPSNLALANANTIVSFSPLATTGLSSTYAGYSPPGLGAPSIFDVAGVRTESDLSTAVNIYGDASFFNRKLRVGMFGISHNGSSSLNFAGDVVMSDFQTWRVDQASGQIIFSGSLATSGIVSISKTGPGSVLFTGDHPNLAAYFSVNNGSFVLGSANALGRSNVMLASNGRLSLETSARVGVLGGSGTIIPTALQATSILTLGQDGTDSNVSELSGDIRDGSGVGSTLGLTLASAPTQRVLYLSKSGGATYSGPTTIKSGAFLTTKAENALSPNSAVTVEAGGNLDISGTDQAIASLEGAGSVYSFGTTNAVLTIGSSNASTTFSGTFKNAGQGGLFGINKVGTGTLTLSGVHDLNGAVTVSAGVLSLSGTNLLNAGFYRSSGVTVTGTGTLLVASINALAGSATNIPLPTLRVETGGTAITGIGVATHVDRIVLAGGTLASGTPEPSYGSWYLRQTISATGNTTSTVSASRVQLVGSVNANVDGGSVLLVTGSFENPFQGVGLLRKTGAGALVITGSATYTGGTLINEGSIWIGSNTATGSIAGNIANDGNLYFARTTPSTYSGFLSGVGTATFLGSVTLTGNNTSHTGPFVLSGGVVQIGSDTALNGGVFQISGPGTLRTNGVERTISNPLNLNSSFTLGRGVTHTGMTTINGDVVVTLNNPDGPANAFSTLSNLSGGGGSLTISAGPNGVGTGGLILSGTGTYTGGVIVNTRVRTSGSATGLGPVTVNSTGVLEAVGFLPVLGGLAGNGKVVGEEGQQLVVNVAQGDYSYDGTLDCFAFVKDGRGTQRLDRLNIGAATYLGLAVTGGGTLVLDTPPEYGAYVISGTLVINNSTPGAVIGGAYDLRGSGASPLQIVTSVNAGVFATFSGGNNTGPLSLSATGGSTLTYSGQIFQDSISNLQANGNIDVRGNLPSVVTGTANLLYTVPGNQSVSFTGGSGGDISVNKNSAGTLTVTTTGGTSWAGPKVMASVGTVSLTGPVTSVRLSQGAQVIVNDSRVIDASWNLANGSLITDPESGSGTVTLTSNLSALTVAIKSGTLRVGNGQSVVNLNAPVANLGTLVFETPTDQTYSQLLSGTGALIKNGTGKLTVSGMVVHTGATTISSGGLTLSGESYTTLIGPVTNNGSLAVKRSGSLTLASRLAGTGSLTNQGTGSILFGSSELPLVQSTISITSGGAIDLGDNDLILTGMTESAARTIIASWWNGGSRDGVGLKSSLASSDTVTTLGVTSAFALNTSEYNTVSVSPNDLIVKYTYIGDTDFSGTVGAEDLQNLLAGIRSNGVLTGWRYGDTNYDGQIDGNDLANLLLAMRLQGAPLNTGGSGGNGPSGGVIPEPASLSLLAAAFACLPRSACRSRRK